MAYSFPFKNHIKKRDRNHLFLKSLINYSHPWDSTASSILPSHLFDSAIIALEAMACGAGTLFIAFCKKHK